MTLTLPPAPPAAPRPAAGVAREDRRSLRDVAPRVPPDTTPGVVDVDGRIVTPLAARVNRTETEKRPSYSIAAGWALLGIVFCANLIETAFEPPTVTDAGLVSASALQWLERGYRFENPEVAGMLVVRGYSIAYFFLFPIMGIGIGVALARRSRQVQFRRLALALTFDYLLSLPFFLAFPVPERWAYPESNAILLSDLWSSALIEAFRPASALNNCFPSFHTSMTVVMVLCCYLGGVRFRTAMIPLGAMVLVSTFALGIHWMGDVLAGVAVGLISVALAYRVGRPACTAAASRRNHPCVQVHSHSSNAQESFGHV